MTKTVVFVEGQTELIFVRELLLKMFDYQNIHVECYTLFTDNNFLPTEHSFGNADAAHYFQIINVGSDQSVLARILRRQNYMRQAGFTRIIGLRDMYCKEYRDAVQNHTISEEVNKKFIEGHQAQITSDDIFFCFAIMEVEAWLLGLRKWFERMDSQLTNKFIENHLGFNLEQINPETHFFHPAKDFDEIYQLIGKHYSKSKGDVNAIAHFIVKEDYQYLYNSGKCGSFKSFIDYLEIPLN